MPEDLVREKNGRLANCCENAVFNQQPTEDVDVHVHVVFGSFYCWNGWWRRSCRGGYLLSALTAESRMLFDFTSALRAKHRSTSFFQANRPVARTDSQLWAVVPKLPVDYSLAIRSVDMQSIEIGIDIAVDGPGIDFEC